MPDHLFPILRKEIRHHTTGQGGGPVIKDTIFMRIGDLFTGAFPMFKIYNVPIGSSILIDDGCIALAVMEKMMNT